ncbi:hypothetical protein FRC09_000379 [Ceratobasidium sp. 395]|nr:hypothetical protein FRC09_000379 [Ceratobasidium sp. 395]
MLDTIFTDCPELVNNLHSITSVSESNVLGADVVEGAGMENMFQLFANTSEPPTEDQWYLINSMVAHPPLTQNQGAVSLEILTLSEDDPHATANVDSELHSSHDELIVQIPVGQAPFLRNTLVAAEESQLNPMDLRSLGPRPSQEEVDNWAGGQA